MPVPIRIAVANAVGDLLTAALPDVPVERARRDPVGSSEMPRLVVLAGGDLTGDPTVEFGSTHWTIQIVVSGFQKASTDAAAELALAELEARALAALDGSAHPLTTGLTLVASSADLHDSDSARTPSGEFELTVQAVVVTATGFPYIND